MSEPKTNKSLGQHWLRDDGALEAMCEAVAVGPHDTVLEIGPGTGTLTRKLAQRAEQVVAVEFDAALADTLSSQEIAANLRIVTSDILKFDLTTLPHDYKVVANIPYYLTSKLIRTLSETTNPASHVALLVQKEVAERVAADPGDMSLLSVSAQFYWQVSLGQVVPAKLFTPAPKVDSQILIMQRRQEPLFPDVDTKLFFQLVKAGFASRRKTLLNSLAGGLRLDKDTTNRLLAAADIEPNKRPQALSLRDWYQLYQAHNQ